MTTSSSLRDRLLLTTAVAAGCLTFFATTVDAATCAPGKVHDKHGHCVVPAHAKKKAATSKSVPYTATSTGAVAPAAVSEPAYTGAPTRSTRTVAGGTEDVVVTGSILRNPNLTSASPITRLTAKELQRRGIVTVAAALQQLSANNAGNLPASFSANGAFANGASAPSLRGLTVDSTLVLIDGQRSAYYPLADDGERNFVDINSIPMSTVQTIDVEKDGASATYGADAVAGVVNIIMRKEIKGFEGGAEGGVSQRGDSGHQRLYATYGIGDLNRDGYNFYINGEYQQDDMLYNRQRGYPYNSSDLTGIGGSDGSYGATAVGATTTAVVRPATVTSAGVLPGLAGTFSNKGNYQPISSTLGCDGLAPVATSTGTICKQNYVSDFRVITPDDRRISGYAHFTGNLSQYVQFTSNFLYSQNDVYYTGTPQSIRTASANSNISTANIYLPVRLTNGQLNPNNPFASQGYVARIYYRFGDIPRSTEDFSQVYRGSAAVNGYYPSNWGGDWKYGLSFIGMSSDLTRTEKGVLSYQGILDAVADGSYNFVDPSQNSAAERAKLGHVLVQNSNSQLYATDMTISKGLFRLPGGMADLGIGGQFRSESLDDPSMNPIIPGGAAAAAQQYLTINGFSAEGSRRTSAGYFEVGLPIIKQLNVDVAGRYDHYSEGFGHFSPKVGVVIKPIKEFSLRGTFSKGFRAPSFAETNSTSIGYITYTPTDPTFLAQHHNNQYTQAYSLGLNTVGNPDLKPELATNFTGGFVFQPKSWLSFTTDYYHIKKSHYITLADYSGPIAEWFASKGTLPSNVVADVPDPDYPNAFSRPGVVNVGYINAAKMVTSGLDMQLQATIPLPTKYLRDVTWVSTGEATYVFNYNVTYPGIGTQRYAGTLGPDNITSASGTPRWRANWSNTFGYKKAALTVTTYYTSGYKTTAEDITGPGTADDCSQAQTGFAGDPANCHVGHFWDVDLTLSYQLTKNVQLYANMYNVGDTKPPLDTGTYGGYQYNPAWASSGIIGRMFHFGATAKF